MDLEIMLVLCLFFSITYELGRERWLGVFTWLCWWLFALVWFKSTANWVLSLIAFAVGLIYFIRILIDAIQPARLRRMIARWSV